MPSENKENVKKKRLSIRHMVFKENEQNDDELERSIKRSEARRSESLAHNESINSLPTENFEVGTIMSHLETCLKLHSENKITQKNAWQIKVIDLITSFVYNNTFANDTLKMASSSLEIGSKIYALRVDDIYALGMEMASNMARAAAQNNKVGADEDAAAAENMEELDQPKATRKRKAKEFKFLQNNCAILEEDENNLVAPIDIIANENWSVAESSSQSLTKLMTYSVPKNSAYTKYLFSSNEPFLSQCKETSEYSDEKWNTNFSRKKKTLCVPFADFNFLSWDPENEAEVHDDPEKAGKDDLVYDEHGYPMHELDGSLIENQADDRYDIFSDASVEEEVGQVCETGRPMVEFVQSMRPQVTDETTEYMFRRAPLDCVSINCLWAGPKHWKLKHITRKEKENDKTAPTKKSRQKKRDIVLPDLTKVDENLHKRLKKPTKKITKKVKVTSMPKNFNIPSSICQHFICKNAYYSTRSPTTESQEPDEGDKDDKAEYDYQNANDSMFCIDQDSINQLDDIFEPPVDNEEMGEMEASELAPKSTVAFATKAKRMNMKKLKCAVWDTISGQNTYEQPDIVDKDTSRDFQIEESSFRKMYAKIPQKIDSSMKEGLSSSLAFVALLHLANEKDLRLNGYSDLSDITIRPDSRDLNNQ